MNEKIAERFEAIKALNTLATMVNNENFYYKHWIQIVPDCATDDDLVDIAEDDDEFAQAIECFCDNFNRYVRNDGGFYIGGECYGESK